MKGLGGETSRGEKSRGEKAGVNRHVAIKFTCNYFHLYSKSTNIVNFSVIFGQNVALNSMNYLYTYFMLEYHFNGHKSN